MFKNYSLGRDEARARPHCGLHDLRFRVWVHSRVDLRVADRHALECEAIEPSELDPLRDRSMVIGFDG